MDPNTSGQGKSAVIPPEISGWSWGAFWLNWIWGLGNSTYIAFLMFVPFVNIVMAFVLGAKGNQWAWQNQHWASVDAFKATQRKWAIWGWIIVGAWIVLIIFLLMMAVIAGQSSQSGNLIQTP